MKEEKSKGEQKRRGGTMGSAPEEQRLGSKAGPVGNNNGAAELRAEVGGHSGPRWAVLRTPAWKMREGPKLNKNGR